MKTKNKTLALLEIAVVLCSVFLMATLPVIAAEQTTQKTSASAITTASEDDYTLGVYGNANEDDTIDMRDTTYIKLAIFGKKTKTDLADANNDGKVSMLDVGQTKLIILGKEKKLSFLDPFGEAMTVNKPVERIVSMWCANAEFLKVLDATDKIVGIDGGMTKKYTTLFPELSDVPDVGGWTRPDYEMILSLQPDIFIPWLLVKSETGLSRKRSHEKKLPGVLIVCMDKGEQYARGPFVEEVKRWGYILDKRDEAEEFINFYERYMDVIIERTEGLSEDEKPKVMLYYSWGREEELPGSLSIISYTPYIDIAGGKNIAADLGVSHGKVDLEWVIKENPDFMFPQIWAVTSDQGKRMSPYAPNYPMSRAIGRVGQVMNSPEMAEVNAVKNNDVHTIYYSHFSSSPAHGICIAYMAKLFHPKLFEDFDIPAIHQEYVDRFLGIDVSVNTSHFMYPPPPS